MNNWSWLTPYVLFLIAGLFWFAFNHPRSYSQVIRAVTWLLLAVSLFMFAYSVGHSDGARDALAFVKDGKNPDDFDFTVFGLWLALMLPVLAILIALEFIHKLRDDKPTR